jgi:hypothetical protein
MVKNLSCVTDKDISSYYRSRRFCTVLTKDHRWSISKQVENLKYFKAKYVEKKLVQIFAAGIINKYVLIIRIHLT